MVVEAVIDPVVAPAAPTHAPFLEKHPPVIFRPFADVEVAVAAPVRFRYVAVIPPVKVELAEPVTHSVPIEERLVVALANCEVEEA